jgi:hypothetical protein
MEKRTVGIIATIAAVLLCGCPGLGAICWGLIFAITSATNSGTVNGNSDMMVTVGTGLGTCCVGIIFIAIPIAVGFFTLRKKAADVSVSDQPPSAM